MKQKIKTIDFLMASEIFLLAIIEFISWRLCVTDNYLGEVKGGKYLLVYYPIACTVGLLVVAIGKVLKTLKFKVCIYTKIISWVFLIIQVFNLSALIFKFGYLVYDEYIYPIFLCTIFSLIFVKIIRWVFQKQ